MESRANFFPFILFFKMMEDLDAMAGNVAFSHVNDGDPLIVTAGVDRIRVGKRPNLEIPNDQYLTGQVTWTGRSSMEIRMQVQSESSDTQERTEWLEAYFT
jgi:acyl-coenzyme A thioesterase 9